MSQVEEILMQMRTLEANQQRILRENEQLRSMLSILIEKEGSGFKEVMNTEEAARYCGLSEYRVRFLSSKGDMPCWKNDHGRRNYYRRDELDRWLASRRVKTNAELRAEAATESAVRRMAARS